MASDDALTLAEESDDNRAQVMAAMQGDALGSFWSTEPTINCRYLAWQMA